MEKLLERNKLKKGFKSKKFKTIIFLASLLIIPIIHKSIFYFYINLRSILLCFQSYDTVTGEYNTLPYYDVFKNFSIIINDFKESTVLVTSLKNSAIIYLFSTFIMMPISLLCSFYIVKKIPFNEFFKVVFFLPSILSSVVMVLMFKYFCEYAVPYVGKTFFGVKNFPLLLQQYPYAFRMMLLYILWSGFSGNIVIYLGAMSQTSVELVEAAELDGINIFGEFWHIRLPSVYPTLTVFLVAGVVSIFTSGGAEFIFYSYGAPRYAYTMSYYMFTKVFGDNASAANYPQISALAMMITLIAAPLTFFVKYMLERFGPKED